MKLPDSNSPLMREIKYYLTIGSFMFTGLLLLQWMRWLNADTPRLSSDGIAWFTPPAIYFLSLPPLFICWIYALRNDHRFALIFSPPAAILSVIGFVFAAGLNMRMYPEMVIGGALMGCVAGAFVFISWREFYQYAFRNERITCVAVMGMSASAVYSLMDKYMWKKLAFSAAEGSMWLLELLNLQMKTGVVKQPNKELATMLSSDNYSLLIFQPCSGLEGMFLLVFLLSIVILFDWQVLKRIKLIETYLIGFIFMYAANILRIVSLFLLGHFAHAPDASPLLASMRGLPIHIFHSFIGQIYYIFAFMIFAHVMYSYVQSRSAKAASKDAV